ncbi:hypothetical protein [Geothrix sp. PMB-07]|uniref:hypothetical protein n=1 Tax=Geothrix sp. PMB-07 TaxID=3068640 RepID=UPI00274294F8|nr:hypothetical protein [Geothrix sp. PMB-07]WLT30416.1 hypothetical protein Q9293_11870 [Geothrix sp. PMB-07]
MTVDANPKRNRIYWIGLIIYISYSLLTLSYWIWDWFHNHGMKRFFLGTWWIGTAPAMLIPTFPSSVSIGIIFLPLPAWLDSFLAKHSFAFMLMIWLWLALVGFIQWFIVVPHIWSKLRGKRAQAA